MEYMKRVILSFGLFLTAFILFSCSAFDLDAGGDEIGNTDCLMVETMPIPDTDDTYRYYVVL